MGRPLKHDLAGKKFGKLTVIEHVGSGRWKCVCECGNETVVNGNKLITGNTKSCGCLNAGPLEDLTGQRFGMLTVIDYAGGGRWNCVCDCGNKKAVLTGALKTGNAKSCGCYVRELPANFDDKTGRRYGRLVVQEYLGGSRWKCLCDCGNVTEVDSHELSRGNVTSCGCYRREVASDSHTTHGMTGSRLYIVWGSMRQRCYNKNNHGYKNYGALGVKVCKEWDSFEAFHDWAYANGYDENAEYGECTLDRIDPFGDYCPENCRWVSVEVQANNKRSNENPNARVPVNLIDAAGNVLKRFPSVKDAAKETGSLATSISAVIHGRQKTTNGLMFAPAT